MRESVRSLAAALDRDYRGDGDCELDRAGSLEGADARALAFAVERTCTERIARTRAGALLTTSELARAAPCTVILSETPYADYARAAQRLHPLLPAQPGIAASAFVDPGSAIDRRAQIDHGATVAEGASVGPGAVIAAGSFVGAGARIGADTRLGPRVVVADQCELGERCIVQPGAVIGSDGFGFANDGGTWIRIPQIGRVLVGDDVAIGANTTIDRGTLEDTTIGDGVILDNQIQIAHNVSIGPHCAMAGCVGIAGSAAIGARCTVGGAAVILGHLEIVDDVHVTAMSMVSRSITQPGTYSSGVPLDTNAGWRRNAARFRQLDRMARRISALEKKYDGNEP